jgi:hypothetical protein
MVTTRKAVIWTAVAAGAIAAIAVYRAKRVERIALITGAVLEADADPKKQQPIGGVMVAAEYDSFTIESRSDASGLFRLLLRPAIKFGSPVQLTFRHPGYQSVQVPVMASREIQIVHLKPNSVAADSPTPITITDVRVRYAMKSTASANVGSTAKTFEIANTGNIPCDHKAPCSPDGKWKAAIGTLSLDAGDEKAFLNVRVSCIAGPCPFTRIESDGYSRGGRVIKVSVRNWSDTVTYLVEAEVMHSMVSDMIRHSFPAIFDRSMNFTLPATAQGPSIEAEVGGAEIVYPLGPALKLSWANCNLEVGANRAKLYRCELKPGYVFK